MGDKLDKAMAVEDFRARPTPLRPPDNSQSDTSDNPLFLRV